MNMLTDMTGVLNSSRTVAILSTTSTLKSKISDTACAPEQLFSGVMSLGMYKEAHTLPAQIRCDLDLVCASRTQTRRAVLETRRAHARRWKTRKVRNQTGMLWLRTGHAHVRELSWVDLAWRYMTTAHVTVREANTEHVWNTLEHSVMTTVLQGPGGTPVAVLCAGQTDTLHSLPPSRCARLQKRSHTPA